jgi:hypothetical protein
LAARQAVQFNNRDAAYIRKHRPDRVSEAPLAKTTNYLLREDLGILIKLADNREVEWIEIGSRRFTDIRKPNHPLLNVDETCIATTYYNGWNDNAVEALKALAKSMGFEITPINGDRSALAKAKRKS